jgi:hypothetical protein
VAVTGSLMSGDAVYYFCHLHSLVIDRDLDPTNEIAHFQQSRSPWTGRPKIGNAPRVDTATGRAIDKYPVGTALLLLPVYVAVYVVSLLLTSLGVPADVSGYGWAYQLAAGWLTALYAVFGCLAMVRVAQARGIEERDAAAATGFIAFATPWLFYATVEPLFAHALSATAVAVLVWTWLIAREKEEPAWWMLSGIVGGAAAIVRYQDALFLLVPAIDVATRGRRRVVALAALALGALLGAVPQLAVNTALWGNPLRTGYAAEGFIHFTDPWLLFTLFSAKAGLLRWSPLLLVSLVGLGIGAWRGWIVARLGLVAFAVQWYVVSSWYFVSQGHTFGNRMLTNCTVFFAAGLAEIFGAQGLSAVAAPAAKADAQDARDVQSAARRALFAACWIAVAANIVLMGLWALGRIGPLAQ